MLVGRDGECDQLRAALLDALGGRTRIVALRGDPGIGKTHLLEFAVSSADRFRVVRMQGYETEGDIPFAVLSGLSSLLLDVRAELPEFHVAALEAAMGIGPAIHGEQAGLAAAVLALLAVGSERQPLLIAVDDVHAIDRSSVDVLGFAFRRLRSEPVAVVLTARMGAEVPAHTERLLDEVPVQISLGGLDLQSARALTAPRGPLPAALWEASGGNPLALLEGAAADGAAFLGQPMRLSLRLLRGYGRRLVELPDPTRQALLLLAVAGDEVDVLDAALAGRGLGRADLEDAETAKLVVLGPGTAGFTHPLMRSAAYQSASPADQRAAHRSLVDAYEGRSGPGSVDRRAFHLAAATSVPDDDVAGQIAQAGKSAMGRQSFVMAAALFERAAHLTPPGTVRAGRTIEAAVAGQAAGTLDLVGRLLERAVDETDDDDLRTMARHLQCRVQMWSGNPGQARDQLVDLADRTRERFSDWSAMMSAQAAVVSIAIGEPHEALVLAARAAESAASMPDALALPVRLTQSVTLAVNGEASAAREVLGSCLPHLASLDPLSIDQPLLLAALAQASLGDIGAAVARLEDLVRRTRNAHAAGLLPFQLSWLSLLCFFDGRWVDALAHGHAAVQSAEETGWATELPNCLVSLATVEAALGREETALGHLADACRHAEGRAGQRLVEAHAARVRGLMSLAAGRPAVAADTLRRAGDFAGSARIGDPVLFAWAADLAEALIRCGERDEAMVAVGVLEREADRTGRPVAMAKAARCRGLLAATVDDARALFELALALHRDAGEPFEEARTKLCFGEVLHRRKQRIEARTQLAEAAVAFRRLGAVVWERRAEDRLRATGLKARSRAPRRTEPLTAKEVQVAVAVADGLSNRDVAMLLVVTPRTVEFHLGNIYRKLGIQGAGARAELTRLRSEQPEVLTGGDG